MAKSPGNKVEAEDHRAELIEALGRFSDARCVLECAVRSLEAWHGPDSRADDEAVCLRHGLELLRLAYNDIDLSIGRLGRTSRAPNGRQSLRPK